jgi:hypothetical protein
VTCIVLTVGGLDWNDAEGFVVLSVQENLVTVNDLAGKVRVVSVHASVNDSNSGAGALSDVPGFLSTNGREVPFSASEILVKDRVQVVVVADSGVSGSCRNGKRCSHS